MLSLNHEQQEPKVGTTSVSQMCKIRHSRLSVIFLQNNNEMLSFAKSFSFKVEGMCLQQLPTLSLIGTEPDGLQIEENLGKTSCAAQLKPDVTSLFVG